MINILGNILVVGSLVSLGFVAFMAWWSPKEVMALVGEQLTNTDSISSIRGVYGGVGLFVLAVLCYLWHIGLSTVLKFLAFFWLLYSLSRGVTWIVDGALGSFGRQWLMIELILGGSCLLLFLLSRKSRTIF